MKKYIENHLLMTLTLGLVAGAIILGAWVADRNQQNAEQILFDRIQAEEKLMLTLATLTDHNGVDEAVENIVGDCTRREEYESLLVSLQTLSKKDLISAQNLFENCGSFYVERKALMVAKLDREFQAYADFVSLLREFREDSSSARTLKTWEELVSLEKNRSTLLRDQSQIQSQIITLLISGSTATSKDVVLLVREAGEMSELLGVVDHKIDELRKGLE